MSLRSRKVLKINTTYKNMGIGHSTERTPDVICLESSLVGAAAASLLMATALWGEIVGDA